MRHPEQKLVAGSGSYRDIGAAVRTDHTERAATVNARHCSKPTPPEPQVRNAQGCPRPQRTRVARAGQRYSTRGTLRGRGGLPETTWTVSENRAPAVSGDAAPSCRWAGRTRQSLVRRHQGAALVSGRGPVMEAR